MSASRPTILVVDDHSDLRDAEVFHFSADPTLRPPARRS